MLFAITMLVITVVVVTTVINNAIETSKYAATTRIK